MLLWFAIPLMGAVTLNVFTWRLWLEDKSISSENDLMENLEIAFLILAFGGHIFRRFQESARELRTYHLTLALLCFSVALRELDIDRIGSNGIWPGIEIAIRSIAVFAWLLIAFCVLKGFSKLWSMRRDILLSVKSLLTYTAIAFYVCSWFFDKGHVPVDPHLSEYIEECLQLTGTVYFFTSAAVPPFYRRKPEPLRSGG